MSLYYGAPLLLLALSGCASPPADEMTANAKPQSCERAYHVGSNIPIKSCSQEMTQDERQRMQDEVRNTIRSNATKRPAGGS